MKREIVTLQAMLGCEMNCEPCPKFFDCTSEWKAKMYESPSLKRIERRLKDVKYKIAVMSGKGGVGKSTVTANLAAAFKLMGAKVGIVDSDFYGPSIPTIMGITTERLEADDEGIVPVMSSHGVKVASVASVLSETEAITWLDDLIRWALYQFLGGTVWGELDFMLIDLPPGTGEETLNVMKVIKGLSGGVILTIPSEVSQIVVGRGIGLCQKANTRVLGVIENMGRFSCPSCGTNVDIFAQGGGKKIAEKMGVPFLGTIPLDSRVSEASDHGFPFVLKYPDAPASKAFLEMAKKIAKDVGYEPAAPEEGEKPS